MSSRRDSRRDGTTAGKTAKNKRQMNAKEAQRIFSRKSPDLAYIFAKLADNPNYSLTSTCQSVINSCLEVIRANDDCSRGLLKERGFVREDVESLALNRLDFLHKVVIGINEGGVR